MKILLLTYYSPGHGAPRFPRVFLLFSSLSRSPSQTLHPFAHVHLPLLTFPSTLHLPFGQLFHYEALDKNFHSTTRGNATGYGYGYLRVRAYQNTHTPVSRLNSAKCLRFSFPPSPCSAGLSLPFNSLLLPYFLYPLSRGLRVFKGSKAVERRPLIVAAAR